MIRDNPQATKGLAIWWYWSGAKKPRRAIEQHSWYLVSWPRDMITRELDERVTISRAMSYERARTLAMSGREKLLTRINRAFVKWYHRKMEANPTSISAQIWVATTGRFIPGVIVRARRKIVSALSGRWPTKIGIIDDYED
ncbi:hypothetical protein ES707_08441 [subsurface metagenome]